MAKDTGNTDRQDAQDGLSWRELQKGEVNLPLVDQYNLLHNLFRASLAEALAGSMQN